MPARRSIVRWHFRLRWRPTVGTAAVILLLVVLPAVADGALWVRIRVAPAHPVAGLPARVRVQTLLVIGADCLDDPHASATPIAAFASAGTSSGDTMDLRALGPRPADIFTVEVKRRADDPTTWEGLAVFPTAGTWMLRMQRPSWPGASGACSGAEIEVQVVPYLRTPGWWWAGPGAWRRPPADVDNAALPEFANTP
jgi:hypothetical protein